MPNKLGFKDSENKVEKGKAISEESKKFLFNLKPNDIDQYLIEELFAFKQNTKPKFCPQDTFILPKDKLYNDSAEATTVGRYIVNLFLLEGKVANVLKYINKPFTSKVIGMINAKCSEAILDEKILNEDYFKVIDKLTWLGYETSKFMNASLSSEFMTTRPEIEKRKNELIKEKEHEIANGDMKAVDSIEKELLGMAKDIYKDHPSMQIYDCGAKGDFTNNYKNTSVMRGCVKDFADPSKVRISTSSLEEGIKPDEISVYANIGIAGEYGKAVETKDGKIFKVA